MAESSSSKSILRAELRQRRLELDANTRKSAALKIVGHLEKLPQWQSSEHVALYASTDEEIGTGDLHEACLKHGKHCYLPVIKHDKSLEFARWESDGAMSDNRFGISEPQASAMRLPTQELDIIFVPLLGWDRSGTRLGMGGGYYDRTLQGSSGTLLVGVSFSAQEVQHIPREPWDIALDAVLTEAGVCFFY